MQTHLPEYAEELVRAIASAREYRSARACLLSTRDREHALALLKLVADATGAPLLHFTVAGRRAFDRERLEWDVFSHEEQTRTALIPAAADIRGGGIVVLEDCARWLSDKDGDTRVRMQLAQALGGESQRDPLVLVFLEPPEAAACLPAMLADQFVRVDVPYPRAGELALIAAEELAVSKQASAMPLDAPALRAEASDLAAGLVGLTRSAARDALRDATAASGSTDGARRLLAERKARQLSRELSMRVIETSDAEEPLGLDALVDWLRIQAARMRRTGEGRARGVLLVGPPGTGKTMLAASVGRVVGLPVVEFRISSLMNSLLGETERRFAQAFATLEAMAPNVVFIDEIEKAFGDSGERDGGTMMRCTGSLLSWLSMNPYPNFIVATANSLARMGEIGQTMTRSERFDETFFVDVPGQAARRAMLDRWVPAGLPNRAEVLAQLAGTTECFSGADLRASVRLAETRADHAGIPVSERLLRSEIERRRTRARALHETFEPLRRWGHLHCVQAGGLE